MIEKIKVIPLVLSVLLLAACNNQPVEEEADNGLQGQAKESITEWISNSDEFPKYKSIAFGELVPRHERTDRSFQLAMMIQQEESLTDSDPARIDSLKQIMELNKGEHLGYIILHRYQTTSLAGEVEQHERLFFLDTSLRVAAMLKPEAFDHILDERVLYRSED